MRALGYWQSMLSDLLPLAAANLFKCSLYIYTSNTQKPVRMVQPDIVKPEVFSKNKEPYVCVMQQTDVTKAVLGVSTELSPKQNKTLTVQNVDIYMY